ncbi:hypothetical protein PUN28_010838 [Cardiocondyla obscurior]
MEQGLSGDPWDCLFGSDSISDAFQCRPEMFHMDIRRCDNTGQIGWFGPGLGFDFDDVLTEPDDDPIGFNDKSRSSNSNLEELNLDSDSELALTLDPNLILPHSLPISSPATNSEVAMQETTSVEETAAENEGEETENESEVERTENDEENESEEEEDIENEENEHNETEYETEEEETEEEEEEEDEETDDDEQDTTAQQPLTSLSVEAPTSITSSTSVGARTLTAATIAASTPTIQLTKLHHPKVMSSTVKVQDIKMLADGQLQQIRKQMSYNNNVHDVNTGATTTVMIQAVKREKDSSTAGNRDNTYPKPAYSYSCLIAMALKNSRTGSLPVSEIYNFMCRHFPYFMTAPTGWKNSVRHNLSLNKCFEKIEKPPGNGSQRKGCLWAIHPSKVAKMDEEVRKWSRKDPTAIKRAMVNPDQLELLERGEMKYEGDRNEETYEDAESYADSETGGSVADEAINDDENVYDEVAKQIDIVDDDIVVEQLYEDLDLMDAAELLDTRLNDFPKQEHPLVYEFVSCSKRQKTLSDSPAQNDYVYQQINATSPRKKAHLVALQSGGGTTPDGGSLLEAE